MPSLLSESIVTPEDIRVWVHAAAQASLKELHDPLQTALKYHEDSLLKTVKVMADDMERNTDRMGAVIANQGRLFVGMGICGMVLMDKELSRREKIRYLLGGLGLLVLVDRGLTRLSGK